MEDNKEQKDNATVSISIQNSTVQVVPQAKEANMIFYGDQFAPKEFRQSASSPAEMAAPATAPQPAPQMSADEQRRAEAISTLKLHITNKERLDNYLQNLAYSRDASQLAQIAVNMHDNEGWPDEVEIKKERFINLLKTLAPDVTKGNTVSNIRARINAIM